MFNSTTYKVVKILDDMDATGNWSVLGNDTTNLETTRNHITGAHALRFDKANGAANTVIAGIERTVPGIDLDQMHIRDLVMWNVHLTTLANVEYTFVRLGTDASNYNEFRYPDFKMQSDVYQLCKVPLAQAITVGDAWDETNITYMAVGVAFDLETNTLADITIDKMWIQGQDDNDSASTEEAFISVPILAASVSADNTFTSAIEMSGPFTVQISGTFVGSFRAQASLDDGTTNTTFDTFTDAGNVLNGDFKAHGVLMRFGFGSGDYTSGTATVAVHKGQ